MKKIHIAKQLIEQGNERLTLLAYNILIRSIRTKSFLLGETSTDPETLERLQAISAENGNKTFFAELFLDEMVAFCAYRKTPEAIRNAQELLALGESMGMWVWVRPARNCFKADKTAHRTNIIFPRGGWLNAYGFEQFTFTDKHILNFLERESENSDGEALLKSAHKASLTVQSAHAEFHAICTPPERQALVTHAQDLEAAANGALFFYGKRYTFDPSRTTEHLNLLDAIENFLKLYDGNKVSYNETRSTCDELFPSRSYTWFSLSPRWIRKTVTIKGEAIKCIDAKALHSNIVYKLLEEMGLNPPEFLTGDSHSKVAAILGITRAEAKTIALSFWNINKVFFTSPAIDTSKIENFKLLKRFYDYLKEHNPEVLAGLEAINKKFRFKDKEGVLLSPHKTLSRVLCAYETLVLAETIKKCRIHRIPVNSVYDAVYCPERKAEKVKEFFQASLDLFAIPTYGEIE